MCSVLFILFYLILFLSCDCVLNGAIQIKFIIIIKSAQPDGNLGGLCQSVPGALQSGVDLSHLYGSFQPHHLQTLITHVCRVTKHTQIKFKEFENKSVLQTTRLKAGGAKIQYIWTLKMR